MIGWDIDPDRLAALRTLGGTPGGGIAGVVGSCDRVVLSLPSDETVAEVLHSADDVLHVGQSIIDTSTGAPAAAVERALRLSQRGVEYLDATVSGSSQQMRRR